MTESNEPDRPGPVGDFERHTERWHEWSTDVSVYTKKGERVGAPERLFVRSQDGLIDLIASKVTSANPGARELEHGRSLSLYLGRILAEWLHIALGKALAIDARGVKPAALLVCGNAACPCALDAGTSAAEPLTEQINEAWFRHMIDRMGQPLGTHQEAFVVGYLAAIAAAAQPVKAESLLPSITCPTCGDQYEGSEIEYDGDEREEECTGCGQAFYVTVRVDRGYRCTAIPAQKQDDVGHE